MSSKNKTYKIHRGIIVETMHADADLQSRQFLRQFSEEDSNQEIQQFEEHRRDFIVIMKNLRRKDPTMNAKQLELMAASEMIDNGTKSKAFFRMKASKKLTGLSSWRMRQESKRTDIDFTQYQKTPAVSESTTPSKSNDRRITKVFFSPGHYTVDEGIGMFTATVVRKNGDLSRQVFVDYATEDADAVAGKDYGQVRGTLCFQPGQTRKQIEIPIIDDLVYEGDQHFYIRLFNLRFGQVRGRDAVMGLVDPDAYSIPDFDFNSAEEKSDKSGINEIESQKDGRVKKMSFTDGVKMDANGIESSIPPPIDDTVESLPTAKTPTKKVSFNTERDTEFQFSNRDDGVAQENSSNVKIENQVNSIKSEPTTPTKKISLNELFHGTSNYLTTQLIPTPHSSESTDSVYPDPDDVGSSNSLHLVCPALATVMILDDDHHGIFSLARREIAISESSGIVGVQILRSGGNRGRVGLTYKTEEGTAEADKDFLPRSGELIFEDGEIELVGNLYFL